MLKFRNVRKMWCVCLVGMLRCILRLVENNLSNHLDFIEHLIMKVRLVSSYSGLFVHSFILLCFRFIHSVDYTLFANLSIHFFDSLLPTIRFTHLSIQHSLGKKSSKRVKKKERMNEGMLKKPSSNFMFAGKSNNIKMQRIYGAKYWTIDLKCDR